MSNNESCQETLEMPIYRCHKRVHALKIKALEPTKAEYEEADGGLWMIPSDERYAPIKLPLSFVDKHKPKEGGYYVVYDDGYASFSPAQAFESGYTLLE